MGWKSHLYITHAMATLIVTHLLHFDREILGEKSSCATNDASVNSDINTETLTNRRYYNTSTPNSP